VKIKTVLSEIDQNEVSVKMFTDFIIKTFDTSGKTLYDKRNIIKSFVPDDTNNLHKELIVKRFKCPNLFQRIVYTFFRSSKAERAFYNAKELRGRGVKTPREIAYIEQFKSGMLKYGYFISEADYSHPVTEELVDKQEFNKVMADCFAAFAAELHLKGVLHQDLNRTNVLFQPTSDGRYTFSLIDNNRMKFVPEGETVPLNTCLENLTRFTFRMDLFEYVIREYLCVRSLPETLLKQAIAVKLRYNRARTRRKRFFKIFKKRKATP